MSAIRPIFLSAQWQYLAMVNYAVPAEILQPHLPKGTELDLWQGEAMVSMVGFLFNHTKVFGIHWPLHTHFEEVNLRLYVRRWDGEKWKRGVAFVSEIVPRPAIAIIANALYNEHYRYMPTRHHLQRQADQITIDYGWKYKGAWNTLNIEATNQLQPIANGSIEHFILEHYWGYNQLNQHTTIEYGVEHEPWQVYPVTSVAFTCNVSGIYGPQWVPYLQAQPHSVMLAHGSDVIVRKPQHLPV
ncbi:YqjF family protein [Phnomibacter sp. MR]|uniref:YqjF family protein n=1 Tax=Phnomibacter sp. MR TaxID=3042318 RepID=UPI003A80FBB3